MSRVLLRESFPEEDMSQMTAASSAFYFNPLAIRIGNPLHRSFNFIIKCRPSTSGIKFVTRPVQWSFAASTNIGPRFEIIFVLTRKGRFCTFVNYDTFLFFCKLVLIQTFFILLIEIARRSGEQTSSISHPRQEAISF